MGALTGIAGVAPTLDSVSLDGPALYQGTDETLPEFEENLGLYRKNLESFCSS